MKPFNHLRFIPINKMKKNKSINKNPTNKSHKRKHTKEPNSNSPSSTRQSCLPVYLTAVNANSADFSVHPQPPLETPKPASSLSKKVKVEKDDKGEKTGVGQGARESQSRSPASVTRSSLFTNGDEIIILQGMMEYAKSKNVSLPLTNLMDFYPFVKGEKATELELMWMELRTKESKIHSKKANFKMELIRLVLNAVKGGGEPSSSATARAM